MTEYPRRAVTRRPMSITAHCAHIFLTICTGGLWGLVYWGALRKRKAVTTYYE